MAEPLLAVRGLSTRFMLPTGPVDAVRHASFEIRKGETLALVGESGSGKSVTALSILQLLPYPLARHPAGSIRFKGREIMRATPAVMREVRDEVIGICGKFPVPGIDA